MKARERELRACDQHLDWRRRYGSVYQRETLMPYADLEVRRRYLRDYKRLHRDKYKPRDKAFSAALHANARAARYKAPGILTVDEVWDLFFGGLRCAYCDTTEGWLGIDHVVPLHAGGSNRPENIVIACHSCNASKFRSDRPHRWSRERDSCVRCGGVDSKHVSHGLCNRCYQRERR